MGITPMPLGQLVLLCLIWNRDFSPERGPIPKAKSLVLERVVSWTIASLPTLVRVMGFWWAVPKLTTPLSFDVYMGEICQQAP